MTIHPLLIHAANVAKFGQEYAVILDLYPVGIKAKNRSLQIENLLQLRTTMPITNLLQPIPIPPASTTNNGLMTAADKQTLTGLVTDTVTNANSTVTLTLANNTVYELTATALTSLTLSGVGTDFTYASVTFTSGSTATVFAMPATGWYCVGAACNAGTFAPEADMRYNLAIEQEADRIAVYVMEAM